MIDFNTHCYLAECVEHSPEWHELRSKGIGGSDAGSVLGINKWKNNVVLWQEKIGIKAPDDLSDNQAVIFGSKVEEPLRAIYALKRRTVVQKIEGTLISKKHQFIRVNLDGYIPEDNGLWEGKSGTIRNYAQLKEWNDSLPPQYYAQCIHALAVTGCDYIELTALLYLDFSTSSERAQIREFRIERKDVLQDIEALIKEECKFWDQVETGTEPFLKMN